MPTRTLHPLIQSNRQALVELARGYGIERLHLIGSLARCSDGPDSDADFLFSLPEGLYSLGRKQFELESKMAQLLGRPVELLADHLVKPWWRPLLNDDMVMVYDDAA